MAAQPFRFQVSSDAAQKEATMGDLKRQFAGMLPLLLDRRTWDGQDKAKFDAAPELRLMLSDHLGKEYREDMRLLGRMIKLSILIILVGSVFWLGPLMGFEELFHPMHKPIYGLGGLLVGVVVFLLSAVLYVRAKNKYDSVRYGNFQ